MRFAVAAITWIAAGLLSACMAAESKIDQKAIAEVAAGKCKVAHAAWWGFDRQESTKALQAAINSGAAKVIVEKMDGPWIVDKIQLADDQELVFQEGVVVEAKKGAFHGKNDSLMTAQDKKNVKLTGPGATLRMHRADYDSSAYTKAEWRHVLQLRGCTNVTVTGLTLAESGGDGIYLGTGRGGATNKNVTIKDVICDRNYRQGISVITAEDLLIENCVLKNTAGTAPAAGIDFEPNHAKERLVNCVMRNCLVEDNHGYAIVIYARPLDATTVPMSVRIENCTTRGTNSRSFGITTSCGPKGTVKGLVEVINCRFEDKGKAGIAIGSNSQAGAKVRIVDCTLADPSDEPNKQPHVLFSTRPGDADDQGNVEFANLTIRERSERPIMQFHDVVGVRIGKLSGTIHVERDGKKTTHTIDQAFVDKHMPVDPSISIPRVKLDLQRLAPAGPVSAAALKLAPHRLREYAPYLIYAEKGQTVKLAMRHDPVGRHDVPPLPVAVVAPSGKACGKFSVPLKEEKEFSFEAKETGVYQIACTIKSHTVRLTSCTNPVSIAGERSLFHFISTTADFYFLVPAGTRQFGVRLAGQGVERVKATITAPDGKKAWEEDNISESKSFLFQPKADAGDQVWKIRLQRPGSGAFEDHFLELRGVPPLISLQPDALLRSRK
jgi:hypothetical protein